MAKKMKGGSIESGLIIVVTLIAVVGILMIILWQAGVFNPPAHVAPVPGKPVGPFSG